MAINLPSFARESVIRLFQLNNDEKKKLLEGLRSAKPSANPNTYAQRIDHRSLPISQEDLEIMIRVLASFYNLVEAERKPEKVARDLVAALRRLKNSALTDAPSEKYIDLENFFIEVFLMHASLGIGAKAMRISSRYERLYGSSEILSDIRPIFPNSPLEHSPIGAVVTHSLRLRAYEDGNSKEVYFAMNLKDLLQLQKVVERALDKHQTLSKLVENFDMHYLPNEGEE